MTPSTQQSQKSRFGFGKSKTILSKKQPDLEDSPEVKMQTMTTKYNQGNKQ